MIIQIRGWISVEGAVEPPQKVTLDVTLPDSVDLIVDLLLDALRRGQ